MTRVLPFGSHCDLGFQGAAKVVDRSNPNAKFSRRAPSPNRDADIFCRLPARAEPLRTGKRSCSPISDPFDGTRKDVLTNQKRGGVKVSHYDTVQSARAAYAQDHPRTLRRKVEARDDTSSTASGVSPAPARTEFITTNGARFSGGKAPVAGRWTNAPSVERETNSIAKPYERTARFRNTKPTTTNVMRPETLALSNMQPKPQRFLHTPRSSSPSLAGVMKPDAREAPPAYKVVAPWHTE